MILQTSPVYTSCLSLSVAHPACFWSCADMIYEIATPKTFSITLSSVTILVQRKAAPTNEIVTMIQILPCYLCFFSMMELNRVG